MKQETKTNRSLLILLAMILAVGLAMGLNTKNTYASSNPSLTMGNQGVLFLGSQGYLGPYGYDVRTIKLHNLPDDVISITWNVDKPKIASVSKKYKNKTSASVVGKKPGTAKVTATITYRTEAINEETGEENVVEKTSKAVKTVIVKKANGIKRLKIGNSSAKLLNTAAAHVFNNEKGKLKISMNKGWKLLSMTFDDGKRKKAVKNGAVLSSKYNAYAIYVTVKDSKTKATYKNQIIVDKYDIWKITYGKMKKNTSLESWSWSTSADGVEGKNFGIGYSKKAKKDEYWNFKNIQDLTNKLSYYDAKRKGNVITLKLYCNTDYFKSKVYWEDPGKGCKVQYIKKAK